MALPVKPQPPRNKGLNRPKSKQIDATPDATVPRATPPVDGGAVLPRKSWRQHIEDSAVPIFCAAAVTAYGLGLGTPAWVNGNTHYELVGDYDYAQLNAAKRLNENLNLQVRDLTASLTSKTIATEVSPPKLVEAAPEPVHAAPGAPREVRKSVARAEPRHNAVRDLPAMPSSSTPTFLPVGNSQPQLNVKSLAPGSYGMQISVEPGGGTFRVGDEFFVEVNLTAPPEQKLTVALTANGPVDIPIATRTVSAGRVVFPVKAIATGITTQVRVRVTTPSGEDVFAKVVSVSMTFTGQA